MVGRIRNRYILILDIILCFTAYALTIAFVFPIASLRSIYINGISLICVTPIIYCCIIFVLGGYRIDWVYSGAKEYTKLLTSCIISAIVIVVIGLFLSSDIFFPKFNIAASFIVMVLMFALRSFIRVAYKYHNAINKDKGKRILVIGAGRLAVAFLRDINENKDINYNVIGLIDDNPSKQKIHIYGTKVIGTHSDIIRICRDQKIDEIIFAIYNIFPLQKAKILNICSKTGLKLKIIPGIEAALNGEIQIRKMREIEIDDLLERDPVKLDNKLIKSDIHGKTVMVTGGGGSIGSELCRQILKFKPERLIILDIYENTTYELQNELEETYPKQKLDVFIASVRDKQRLDSIFQKYELDIVFHAAAHKHVPLMEFSPCEAIKNNTFGTYNVARCAVEYGVKRFVLISTDKSVNPTNIMGASKRMCEMIVQTMQNLSKTDFVAVRFGNVLGSNGSVIPRFKKQIAEGGPVTVTHPDITRFFMTISEATQLVLQAAAYATGGEIFVLDMGQPVKIYDLAEKMIRLSGLKPEKDIEIKFTGLRAGEKLYEELLMKEEGLRKTAHSKIFVGQPIDIDIYNLLENLEKLGKAMLEDDDTVKTIVSEVVPTYRYSGKKNNIIKQEIFEMV